MRKVLLFSIGCLLATSTVLFGQSTAYHSIFTSQTQWNLFVLQYATGTIVPTVQKIVKDTTMLGQRHMVFTEDANAIGRNIYLQEDAASQKVYVVEDNETNLLYDFNLKVGDLFKFKDLEFEVISVGKIALTDGNRKRIELKCLTKTADFLVWIEGIGATISPLYYKHFANSDTDVKVTCFFRAQQLEYSLSDFPCALPLANNDIIASSLSMSVSPNPFSDNLKINIKNPENEDFALQLFSITGVLLYSEKFNNLSQEVAMTLGFNNLTSGVYLLNITSSKGLVTQKIIKK